MKKSAVFLFLLAAACSKSGPTPEQQRIVELEAENAQLQAQLKESRDNVTKLHAAMGHGGSIEDDATEEAAGTAGAVAPQPVVPQPATNLGGGDSGGSGHGGNSKGYVE